MENRMRDLEQIQERSLDDRSHRIGTVLLAVLTILGFTFAMGIVVGRAASPDEEVVEDPLAHLDSKDGLRAKQEPDQDKVPTLKLEAMTFPDVLAEDDGRPEVKAAQAAAAAEEADLEAVALPQEVAAAPKELPAPQPVTERQIAAALPASIAAGKAAGKLARDAVEHDPLVSAAISEPPKTETAPPGQEGAFTLQVVSYEQPGPAQAFAKGLRARGHQAFVTSADVPGRGRFWRVRVGPFATKWEADAYREKFEEQERMNTIVVRHRD